jgi:RNA polymerase sigma factor (sigma-70 family)
LKESIHIPNNVIEKAVAGDMYACNEFYQLLSSRMFGICVRMLGNREDAQDVLQNAFIIGFKNLFSLKKRESVVSWIQSIVIRECIRCLKNKTRPLELNGLENIEEEEEEEEWIFNIPAQAIHEEVQRLPQGYREVFCLYAYENYSHKQIATILDISESTSKSQYHRARKAIKIQLKERFHG